MLVLMSMRVNDEIIREDGKEIALKNLVKQVINRVSLSTLPTSGRLFDRYEQPIGEYAFEELTRDPGPLVEVVDLRDMPICG